MIAQRTPDELRTIAASYLAPHRCPCMRVDSCGCKDVSVRPSKKFFRRGVRPRHNPALRARGENATDADSEPTNLRCWITGSMPDPGYTYRGTAFEWPTIPDVLDKAGIGWRIYQDPNDNWTGAMHGCLAFKSFRTASPESSIYKNGLSRWSLEDLANDVKNGTLPQVCWVLPTQLQSEHPG